MTWKDALDEFSAYLILEKGASENTRENYLRDIQKLALYFKATSPIEISYENLTEFLHEYANLNYSPRSHARLISAIKGFFKYLILEDKRADNPATLLESPKIGTKIPQVLSLKEIDLMFSKIDLSHPQGQRNKAILETLYGCGLRVSEIINLKISDLYFDENFIRVTGKGNKQRLVPIAESTIHFINLYKDQVRIHQKIPPEFSDILFLNQRGKSLTRVMIFYIIKELTAITGLDKNVSPHTFRHSFATHLLKNGADLRSIQMMLGHESITTTEIYTHLDNQHLRTSVLNHHPRNKK